MLRLPISTGELHQPESPVGRLREHREHEVLEVGQLGVVLQLGVERRGQPGHEGDERPPRLLLINTPSARRTSASAIAENRREAHKSATAGAI